MNHNHIRLIIAAAALVMAVVIFMPKDIDNIGQPEKIPETSIAETAETSAPPSAPALMIEGAPVNPLCFLNVMGESPEAPFPVENCGGENIALNPEAAPGPLDEDYLTAHYVISAEDEQYPGVVAYRYLGEHEGHDAVLVIQHGGGSGVFSALLLLDYDADSRQLVPARVLAAGDRCNGGVTGAAIADGALVYETDVTPYEMMGLAGDPERPVIQSDAAAQLPSCSICCYGRAQFENGEFTGITLDSRLLQGFAAKTYSEEKPAERCFDDLVKLNIENGQTYLNAEEFASFVREIEHVCLGRTEGE